MGFDWNPVNIGKKFLEAPVEAAKAGFKLKEMVENAPVVGGMIEKTLDNTVIGKKLDAVQTAVEMTDQALDGNWSGIAEAGLNGLGRLVPDQVKNVLDQVENFTGFDAGEFARQQVLDRLPGGDSEDPTAAIANLASEVSDLSLEEIANLSPSQLDAIFEDAGVSPDMVNQLVEDTVGYSDPSSSSTYDSSDPNGTVNASNFLGNNGSGNNVVNPFSTSNLANVGNVGTNTTGGNNNTTGGNNNTTTGTTTTGGTDPFQPKYDENFLENFDLGPEVNPIEHAGKQRDKLIDQFIAGKVMDDARSGIAEMTSDYETDNQVRLDFVETGNSYITAATTSMKKKAEKVEQEAERG